MGKVKVMRASAGAGKTHNLVGEYLDAVVAEPGVYKHILAVTFTNKATEEMKERILRELHTLASGAESRYTDALMQSAKLPEERVRAQAAQAQANILHDFSHFHVMTIDRFFQGILRAFLRELGISPDFALELQTDSLLEKAADALIERSAGDEGLKAWIGEFVGERLDESAGWDVRGKLASAGRDVLNEGWDPAPRNEQGQSLREMLGQAVTLATEQRDKAMGEIRRAAQQALGIMDEAFLSVADFYYGKQGVAGYLHRTAAGNAEDYKAKSRVRTALESGDGTGWVKKDKKTAVQIEAILPQLGEALGRVCSLWDENRTLFNSVAVLRGRFRTSGLLDDMAREVERLCAEGNIIPMAQTNRILSRLVAGNDTPFIYEKTGNRFSRFLIDEFQDTSRTQWDNFVPLLQNAIGQSTGTPVLLVGDAKQSIYRWRGGDWRILSDDVPQTFGQPELKPLGTNFRSLREVVEFNNRAIGQACDIDRATLGAMFDQARGDGYLTEEKTEELSGLLSSAYEGFAQQVRPGNEGGYVTVSVRGATPEGEPDPVILRVEELQRRGYRASQIAILVRRNREAQLIARMLLDRKAAQPGSPYCYDVVTAEALQVGSSPASGFLVACLRLATDPGDPMSRAVWNRFRGRPAHEVLPEEETAFLSPLALRPPQEAFNKILIRYDIQSRKDDAAYVQALHEQLVRFCRDNIADLPLFLKWWGERGATEAVWMPSGGEAIRIITVHKAKGLEFPAVIMPYCSWPLAPRSGSSMRASCAATPFAHLGSVHIGHAREAAESWFSQDYYTELTMAHVDNINLLYVALTRAERELHVYIPRPGDKKEEITTAGDLLRLAAERMEGEMTQDDERMRTLEFGSPAPPPAAEARRAQTVSVDYFTREAGPDVKLRLPSSRYFEETGSAPALSPRHYGMLMHRVFERADDLAQLQAALAAIRTSGDLSEQEGTELERLVRSALADRRIASWFDGGWQRVRNENDIIVPGGGPKRPDRVMVREDEAVVVDYKFGSRQDAAHRRQVGQYMELLRQMGYRSVTGYLWYVTLGEVEQC